MATLKDNSGNTATVIKFGGASGVRSRTASKLNTSGAVWSATDISVKMNEDTGTPSGDIQIGIFVDNGGKPSTTQVGGYATITAAEISGTGIQDFTKSFSSPATLNYGFVYWIVFRVASGESDAAYYSSKGITNAASNNGAQYNEPSVGVWSNNTDDLYYILTGTVTTAAPTAGSYLLTGNDVTLHRVLTFTASVGSFLLTGVSTTFTLKQALVYTNQSKHSISPANSSKNSISPTNSSKHSISPTNSSKNLISPVNLSKNLATFTNQAKT